MDPQACLLLLQHKSEQSDFAEAVAALNNYYRWRIKGGFEPHVDGKPGDEFADDCANKLADSLADTASSTLNPKQRLIACGALRVAAVQYQIDATACRDVPRTVEQFEKQSREAIELADRLESA